MARDLLARSPEAVPDSDRAASGGVPAVPDCAATRSGRSRILGFKLLLARACSSVAWETLPVADPDRPNGATSSIYCIYLLPQRTCSRTGHRR